MKVLADSVLNEDSLPSLQSCYVFTGREREREREREKERKRESEPEFLSSSSYKDTSPI